MIRSGETSMASEKNGRKGGGGDDDQRDAGTEERAGIYLCTDRGTVGGACGDGAEGARRYYPDTPL